MPQHYGNKKKSLSAKGALAKRSAAAKRKRTADAAKVAATRPSSRRSSMSPKVDIDIQDRLVPNIGTPVQRRRVPEFPPAFETDFPYGRPVTPKTVTPKTVTPKIVTPKIVTPKPTRNRTGTTKRKRR